MLDADRAKQLAAEAAFDRAVDGMCLALGTGSTVEAGLPRPAHAREEAGGDRRAPDLCDRLRQAGAGAGHHLAAGRGAALRLAVHACSDRAPDRRRGAGARGGWRATALGQRQLPRRLTDRCASRAGAARTRAAGDSRRDRDRLVRRIRRSRDRVRRCLSGDESKTKLTIKGRDPVRSGPSPRARAPRRSAGAARPGEAG